MSPVRVKICGITSVEDARMCVDAGADAIGLNFWSGSVRACGEAIAREIVAEVAGKALVVGVFVDAAADELTRTKGAIGLDCLQLHGEETPELLTQFLPHAYKALRVRDYGRVDLRMDEAGNVYVIEVNASCYLERNSELAMAAKAAGIEYEDLLERIVQLALERRR